MKNSIAFKADLDTESYLKKLQRLSKTAIPDAVAESLNRTADAVTGAQIKNARRLFKIRTPFTLRSMVSSSAKPWRALNKARGKDIDRMFSRAGTYSRYLWMQDVPGGFEKKGIDGPVPIPTLSARTGKSENKPIAARYRMRPFDSLQSGTVTFSGGSAGFIGTPRGGGKFGVYERFGKGKRLRMIRNLENESVHLRDTNFFSDAVGRYGTPQFVKSQWKKVISRMAGKEN